MASLCNGERRRTDPASGDLAIGEAKRAVLPEADVLLGRVEEIVRRGRVLGFIPWLITQRPAVVSKNVPSYRIYATELRRFAIQRRAAWRYDRSNRRSGMVPPCPAR